MDAWGKYKEDWQIKEKKEKFFDERFKGIRLFRLTFPTYWINACNQKNDFYNKLKDEAEQYVKDINESAAQYLKGDRYNELWHTHCDFCYEEMTTEIQKPCYCSENFGRWICEECFNKFKKRFEWNVEDNISMFSGKYEIVENIRAKE